MQKIYYNLLALQLDKNNISGTIVDQQYTRTNLQPDISSVRNLTTGSLKYEYGKDPSVIPEFHSLGCLTFVMTTSRILCPVNFLIYYLQKNILNLT